MLISIPILFFLTSCAPSERHPLSRIDTPDHHCYAGIQLMNQGKYDDAAREFQLAIMLDEEHSQAHAGAGLVKAFRGDFAGAFEFMAEAGRLARQRQDKAFYHVGMMRLYTMRKGIPDWLDRTRREFEQALIHEPASAAAYYFMGLACKAGLQFQDAASMFARVLDLNEEYIEETYGEWKLVQKIVKAQPETETAKKIALMDSITRADMAALMIRELRIDELYDRWRSPVVGEENLQNAKGQAVKDIAGHVFEEEIQKVLGLEIEGLEPYSDGTFRPDDLVSRANLAVILQDVLAVAEHDDTLSTKYREEVSPFPDVKNDSPSFNAVMVVTARGIMRAHDLTSGEFAPFASVPGPDALLIMRNMKEELRMY